MHFLIASSITATLAFGAVEEKKKSAYEQNAELAEKMIATLKDYGDAMELVEDKASAKTAAVKLNAATDRMEKLAKKLKTVPKVTKSEKKKLDQKYIPQLRKISARFQTAAKRAAKRHENEPTFLKALRRMQRVAEMLKKTGKKK